MGNVAGGAAAAAAAPSWEGTVIVEFARPGHRNRLIQMLAQSSWTMQQFRAAIGRLCEVDPSLLVLMGKGQRLRHEDYLSSLQQCGITPGDVVLAEFAQWQGRIYVVNSEDYRQRFSLSVASHYTVAQLLFAIHCKTGLPAGSISLAYFRLFNAKGKDGQWDHAVPPHAPDTFDFSLTLAELGIGEESTVRMSVDAGVLDTLTPDARKRLELVWGGLANDSPKAQARGAAYSSLTEAGSTSLESVNVGMRDGVTITSDLLLEWKREHPDRNVDQRALLRGLERLHRQDSREAMGAGVAADAATQDGRGAAAAATAAAEPPNGEGEHVVSRASVRGSDAAPARPASSRPLQVSSSAAGDSGGGGGGGGGGIRGPRRLVMTAGEARAREREADARAALAASISEPVTVAALERKP